jgi:hypothetical protein
MYYYDLTQTHPKRRYDLMMEFCEFKKLKNLWGIKIRIQSHPDRVPFNFLENGCGIIQKMVFWFILILEKTLRFKSKELH